MNEPANTIIQKLGGHDKVAEIAEVDVSRTYRWTYPEARGGSNGWIPAKHHTRLIEHAAEIGVPLTYRDFYSHAVQPPCQ